MIAITAKNRIVPISSDEIKRRQNMIKYSGDKLTAVKNNSHSRELMIFAAEDAIRTNNTAVINFLNGIGYSIFLMNFAVEFGNLEQVRQMHHISNNSAYTYLLILAGKGGNIDVINYLTDEIGMDKYRKVAFGAAKGGHISIINTMIDRGVDDYERIAYYAAAYNHIDIVMYMFAIIKGIYVGDTHNKIAAVAAKHDNVEIVNYMINEGAKSYHLMDCKSVKDSSLHKVRRAVKKLYSLSVVN